MRGRNKTKLRLIGVLMLVSLSMLGVVIFKWVQSQYRDEKSKLVRELLQIYKATSDQVVDSLVKIEFSATAPDEVIQINSAVPKVHTTSRHNTSSTEIILDSTRRGSSYHVRDKATPAAVSKEHATASYRTSTTAIIVDSSGHSSSYQWRGESNHDSVPHNMAMGVKRFIVKLSDEGGLHGLANIDTVRIMNVYRKNVLAAWGLHIRWASRSDSLHSLIIPTSFAHGAAVDHYQPILFRKITPQILFSFLLLICCGGAFVLSYNTVRRQMRLSAQKDSFISNISHELKTPVATAKVAIEALRNFDALEDPVKTHDYLEIAGWEIDRLETLIGTVLNNMQLEEGRIILQKEPVDLQALLQDIVRSMQPVFRKHHKTVALHAGQASVLVAADKIHLQGAVYNILDNAVKYGGDRISMELRTSAGQAILSVSDNGPGIPPEYSRKIFERFFRIPSGNVHDVKGYGLGLNYTHYVALAHDGSISQQNNEGGGAVFILSLPTTSVA